MPWQEMKPMDQKIMFIADYLRNPDGNFSSLCRRYDVSRKTGYKWRQRYVSHGVDGLEEQSRKPHSHPDAISYTIRKAIIECRKAPRIVPGPKKIQAMLRQRYPDSPTPSVTSIYNILKQQGLVSPLRRRNRVTSSPLAFAPVSEANDLWTVDFKGQWRLANKQWCYPLTLMDHHSRYLLHCQGLKGTRWKDSQRVFEEAFREYGLPKRIRSDNGVPFATRAAGGLSSLSIWWIRLGILPERIKPGKPQQNGQHERMHRTLKEGVKNTLCHSYAEQQQQLDLFRHEYNYQRPHEALEQQTPASRYVTSPRTFPCKLPKLQYPSYFHVRKVQRSGIVYWKSGYVYVTHLLEGELVGLEEVDEGIWEIYFGALKIGRIDERDATNKAKPYWSVKCNPCI